MAIRGSQAYVIARANTGAREARRVVTSRTSFLQARYGDQFRQVFVLEPLLELGLTPGGDVVEYRKNAGQRAGAIGSEQGHFGPIRIGADRLAGNCPNI